MMADFKTLKHWTITLDGTVYSGGSAVQQQTTSGITQRFAKTASVATATTHVLFDVTTDLTDFDKAIIESDQDIEVEKVSSSVVGAAVLQVETIKANHPYLIESDVIREGDHTVGWGADGTAGKIVKLEVKNSSGSTAQVSLEAYT